jgi:pyridoxine 5-phosphate synthase
MHELNIGHALIADSVFVGLETAVKDMLSAMRTARAAVGL